MITPKLLVTLAIAAAAPQSIASLQWEKRVLLIAAPNSSDPLLKEQRRVIAGWRSGAHARNLVVVEVVGTTVAGASDPAQQMRQRYHAPAESFAVVLIGKDGGIKLRSARPIPATVLERTIDAMPMRRGGGR